MMPPPPKPSGHGKAHPWADLIGPLLHPRASTNYKWRAPGAPHYWRWDASLKKDLVHWATHL